MKQKVLSANLSLQTGRIQNAQNNRRRDHYHWGWRRQKNFFNRRNIEPFKGQWCLPGGHIDREEPAREAIIREVKEETGLDFEARFFNYFDEIIPSHGIHAVVLVFEGAGTGQVKIQENEVSESGWFTLEETRSLDLAFAHNRILEAYSLQ